MHQKISMLDKNEPYSIAARARLRQSIGKPLNSVPNVWDIVLSFEENLSKNAIQSAYTVMGLYALHRQGKPDSMNEKNISFGTAIAKLVTNEEQEKSVKRRFNAVATSTDFAELAYHARALIQLLKASDIKMDYPKFTRELYSFQFSDSAGKIRLQWGEDFYRNIYRKDKESTKNEN